MDKISEVLNLEPTPNDMPQAVRPWLDGAKDQLRDHFKCRIGQFPVYDRVVIV